MESLELNSQPERVAGIPGNVLNEAIVVTAGNHNPDIQRRVEEVIAQGGDALTFLGGCIPGSSKDAIGLAHRSLMGGLNPTAQHEFESGQRRTAITEWHKPLRSRDPLF